MSHQYINNESPKIVTRVESLTLVTLSLVDSIIIISFFNLCHQKMNLVIYAKLYTAISQIYIYSHCCNCTYLARMECCCKKIHAQFHLVWV